ncbi:MAG TPA: heme-binding domain-containing protein [Candidatus Binatia bacterium]|nr:heme-binding domain-containing protein [Candidatus Binatia bacterium]
MAILLLIQAAPYGRDHINPPARAQPAWDNPRTQELTVRACFDCHSNATVWPWYSYIAPISWLIERDVKEGRRELNFSEWNKAQEEAGEAANTVRKGSMPPWYYPWARLSSAERQDLIQGLERTLGSRQREKRIRRRER